MPTPATAEWPRPKSEDEWEDMVLDAMRLRWRDPNAVRNGRRGQRQNGVDIFGQVGASAVGAQAKNTDRLSQKAARAELKKAEQFPSAERVLLRHRGSALLYYFDHRAEVDTLIAEAEKPPPGAVAH